MIVLFLVIHWTLLWIRPNLKLEWFPYSILEWFFDSIFYSILLSTIKLNGRKVTTPPKKITEFLYLILFYGSLEIKLKSTRRIRRKEGKEKKSRYVFFLWQAAMKSCCIVDSPYVPISIEY